MFDLIWNKLSTWSELYYFAKKSCQLWAIWCKLFFVLDTNQKAFDSNHVFFDSNQLAYFSNFGYLFHFTSFLLISFISYFSWFEPNYLFSNILCASSQAHINHFMSSFKHNTHHYVEIFQCNFVWKSIIFVLSVQNLATNFSHLQLQLRSDLIN